MTLLSRSSDNFSIYSDSACNAVLEMRAHCFLHTSPIHVFNKSPELSDYGRLQIEEVAETLNGLEAEHGIKVDKIISSPLIRCVQTSDIVAEAMGIDSISLEYGLVEEAKSFRGHPPNEPAPVWTPLVLDRNELSAYSSRLNDGKYESMTIKHEEDYSCTKNGVREVHLDDTSIRDPVQITLNRCRHVLDRIERIYVEEGVSCILVVSHYAIVKGIAAYLREGGLDGHMKVGSFGCFRGLTQPSSTTGEVQRSASSAAPASGSTTNSAGVLSQSVSPATVKEISWEALSAKWEATKRVPPRPR